MFGQQQQQGNEQLDVAGLTNLLRGASDAQVLSITASVCSVRQGLQDKILELLVQPPQPRVTGMIKSFFPDKQYGFIDCPEAFQLYQRDVFLSGQQIGPFQPGQKVSFVVTQGNNGQPQAQDLQDDSGQVQMAGGRMMGGMQGGMQGGGRMQLQGGFRKTKICNNWQSGSCPRGENCTFAHGDHEIGSPQQAQGGQGGFQAAAQQKRNFQEMGDNFIPQPKKGRCDPNAPRAIGIIKNFNLEKKFGFIDCPDVTAQFGRDAFLSIMQVGNFQVGQTVSFAITANSQGHPQAQDLQDAEGGQGLGTNSTQEAGQQQRANPTGGLDVTKGWTPELEQHMLDMANTGNDVDLDNLINMMGGLQGEGGAGGNIPGLSAPTGDRAIGMINKFDINKKYGFVDCPQLKAQFGYDAFLSSMQIGEFQNGMTVSFDYQLKNGRPQASNLMPA